VCRATLREISVSAHGETIRVAFELEKTPWSRRSPDFKLAKHSVAFSGLFCEENVQNAGYKVDVIDVTFFYDMV
jgi:hypothetical protein